MSKATDFLVRAITTNSPQTLAVESPSPRANDLPGQQIHSRDQDIELILPGSFNPLHDGHLAMADFASQLHSSACWFELTLSNADKGVISSEELDARIAQDYRGHGLVLSTAARFCEKSAVFPGVTFVLGVDTIIRLANPSYYGDSSTAMMSSFSKISAHQCRFLVFGRRMAGKFHTGRDLELPSELAQLCQFVDQSEFAFDISSTNLRAQQDG